jgi:integrase/recombinase XerD
MKQGGYKNYQTTISYLKLFLTYPGGPGDIYLSQLNMHVATEFEYFVRNNPVKAFDPCLGNGIAKHVQRFKRIINWAVEIEWLSNNPIEKYSCPIKKKKKKINHSAVGRPGTKIIF